MSFTVSTHHDIIVEHPTLRPEIPLIFENRSFHVFYHLPTYVYHKPVSIRTKINYYAGWYGRHVRGWYTRGVRHACAAWTHLLSVRMRVL